MLNFRFIETFDQLEADTRDPSFTVDHPLDAYRFIRNHSTIFKKTVTEFLDEIDRTGKGKA